MTVEAVRRLSVVRRRRPFAETRPQRHHRRIPAIRRADLGDARLVRALAGAKIFKNIQAGLRAAILQREPVVPGKDRKMTRAADDVGTSRDARIDAGAACVGGAWHEVICLPVRCPGSGSRYALILNTTPASAITVKPRRS